MSFGRGRVAGIQPEGRSRGTFGELTLRSAKTAGRKRCTQAVNVTPRRNDSEDDPRLLGAKQAASLAGLPECLALTAALQTSAHGSFVAVITAGALR